MDELKKAIANQAATIHGFACNHWCDSEENDAREALEEMAMNNKAAKILDRACEELKALVEDKQKDEKSQRSISVNMNGLRLNAIRSVNRLIETLNSKIDGEEIRVFVDEIEQDLEDVRTSVACMGCVKLDGVEGFDFLDFQTTFFNAPDEPKGFVKGVLVRDIQEEGNNP